AQLMGAAGFGAEAEQAAALGDGELFPVRHRRLAFRIADHAPAGLGGRDLGERQVDRAAIGFGYAIDDRKILLLDLAAFERAGEAAVRLGIAREQQATRGVAIEPVDRERPTLETEAQRIEMILQAETAVARRVDGKPRGLVDDE